MNWYIGQLVVCITSEQWVSMETMENVPAPLKGDVLEVDDIDFSDGITWLSFLEWPGGEYNSMYFVPVATSKQEADMKEAIEESLYQPATL